MSVLLCDCRSDAPLHARRIATGERRRGGALVPRVGVGSELQSGAGVHHRGASRADRRDDLVNRDPFEVRASGAEVAMPELPLDGR